MKLKFYFQTNFATDCIDMFLIGEDAVGKRFLAKPFELAFVPIEHNGKSPDPTLTVSGMMSREFLPALANGLAEAGFRHESTDVGELKATKYHLEDMRKVALK